MVVDYSQTINRFAIASLDAYPLPKNDQPAHELVKCDTAHIYLSSTRWIHCVLDKRKTLPIHWRRLLFLVTSGVAVSNSI